MKKIYFIYFYSIRYKFTSWKWNIDWNDFFHRTHPVYVTLGLIGALGCSPLFSLTVNQGSWVLSRRSLHQKTAVITGSARYTRSNDTHALHLKPCAIVHDWIGLTSDTTVGLGRGDSAEIYENVLPYEGIYSKRTSIAIPLESMLLFYYCMQGPP